MDIISKATFLEKYKEKITQGAVFIYPTDTIYGIGCDATNNEAVKKIRELKERDSNPFSVVAPSKQWIEENCEVHPKAQEYLEKLPGPYTFILKVKEGALSEEVNPGIDSVGVRIPNNWFSKIATELNIPIVSTSANKSGQPNMTSVKDLNENIKENVDFIIDDGEMNNPPSTIINLTDPEKITEIQR